MQKPLVFLTLLFLFVLVCGCQQKTAIEQFAQEAREFTLNQCPKQVDACTRMDSTTFCASTLTYCFNYTVSEMLDNDSVFQGETRQKLHDALLADIRTSIALMGYKEAGITLSYRYFSAQHGTQLGEFTFRKEDYGR